MGHAIHFSQQNAEATSFEGASFDLVFTAAVFHESSYGAIRNMIQESHRLLRPGGVMVHLEVPSRYSDMDIWQKIEGEFEIHYNNEPCWREAMSADYDLICRQAGFVEVATGFQPTQLQANRGEHSFSASRGSGRAQWYIISARK